MCPVFFSQLNKQLEIDVKHSKLEDSYLLLIILRSVNQLGIIINEIVKVNKLYFFLRPSDDCVFKINIPLKAFGQYFPFLSSQEK